jgi:hypothetical protein
MAAPMVGETSIGIRLAWRSFQAAIRRSASSKIRGSVARRAAPLASWLLPEPLSPSFGTRGSQVQILPLRPILSRILDCFRDRYRDRNVIHVVAGRRALACSRAEAPMVFDLFDQSGLCILPRSQPMPSATIAVV